MADFDSSAESVKETTPKRYKPNPGEGDKLNPDEGDKPNPSEGDKPDHIRRFADDEEDAVDDKDMGLVLRKRGMLNVPMSRLWLPVEKVQGSGEIVTEWVLAPEGVIYCAWCKTGTDHNVYNCKDVDWTKETYCGMCDSLGHQEPDCPEMEPFLGCNFDDDY